MMLTPDNLRPYQWRAIKFLCRTKHAALFLDMGLGKTISVLSAIVALKRRERLVRPVLVVAPIRVMHTVWKQEAAKWSHTQGLTFSIVHGSAKQRLEALDVSADVYITNPHNIRWLLELLQNVRAVEQWPFGMLVIDESSAFKSPGTQRFRRLRHFVHLFDRRVIMTGTPTPNHLLELWPQMFIVDGGARLGTAFYRFRDRFFMVADYGGYRYAPRRRAEQRIIDLVADVTLRMDAKDWISVPPTVYNTVWINLPHAASELYREFERTMFLEMDTGSVDAVHAASLSMRCHQLANGAVYTRDDEGEQHWEAVHDEKLHAVREIVDEAGSNVLIAYNFKHDLHRLRAVYPDAPVLAESRNIAALVDEWNAGKHAVILVHPASAGHGLNMQFGGHVLVFFSLTWSLELHDQLVSRIGNARAQKRVIVHYVCARDTVDEAVLLALTTKAVGQTRTMDMLRRHRINVLAQRAGVADLLDAGTGADSATSSGGAAEALDR